MNTFTAATGSNKYICLGVFATKGPTRVANTNCELLNHFKTHKLRYVGLVMRSSKCNIEGSVITRPVGSGGAGTPLLKKLEGAPHPRKIRLFFCLDFLKRRKMI